LCLQTSSQDRYHTWLKKVSGEKTQWPENLEIATFPTSISVKFPTDSKCWVLWKSQLKMKSPVSSSNWYLDKFEIENEQWKN
jgi:hypothetical protein